MINKADTYVEYREIPEGTPEERMKFYIDSVNEAFQENRSGISRVYDEIMEVTLTDFFKVDMDGKVFVCFQWSTVKRVSKEEFFEE